MPREQRYEERLAGNDVDRFAAQEFLNNMGLVPTKDTIDQLLGVFVPCLRIMCERGYDPEGDTWREAGWRPQLYESMKKLARIKFWAWFRAEPGQSLPEVPDLINYLGFFQRGVQENIPAWGEWGAPS